MSHFILETGPGDVFSNTAAKAKKLTTRHESVEFDFNGIGCFVDKDTVLEWLERDYMNAHIMEWKCVGPKCEAWYDDDTEIKLYSRRLDAAKERKERAIERQKQDEAAKSITDGQINGVTFLIHPEKQQEYTEYVTANSNDGYSRAVIEYGETWAKLMQVEISKGRTEIKDIAYECQKGLGYLGITGFQYGCVVKGLSHFWVFGEELRKWHNKEYNHEGDGVVNPAVLTVKA